MQDEEIIALYFRRDEAAIAHTRDKYGRYLDRIAYNILYDRQDSEESVSETYLKAWNAMPPHRPAQLGLFLGKITRQVSIDLWRKKSSRKRSASQYALSLSELEECVSGGDVTLQAAQLHALTEAIARWLRGQSRKTRDVFLCRYYFLDSVRQVAQSCAMTEANVKTTLFRARQSLRAYLEQEGFEL